MVPIQTAPNTREKLLHAAQDLMIGKGFTATSVDEICGAAGVTKGSFFHYFDGKEELGRILAQHFYDSMQQAFKAAPFHSEADPLDRVLGRTDFFVAMARTDKAPKGCLLGMFVQELSATHPGIRSVCADCFDASAQNFERDLEEAKAKYAPDATWSPKSVANHLTAVMQGSIILAKAKQDRSLVEQGALHFQAYVRSLFGK